MASPPVLLSVFLLLLLQQSLFSSANASSVVEQTCKQVRGKGVGFDFCVNSLQKDPNSDTAGRRGLAVIATKQTKMEFIHAWNAVKKLLHGNVTAADKKALRVCSHVYEDGADALQHTIVLIGSGYDTDAVYSLTLVYDDPSKCDNAFDQLGNKLLVARLNEETLKFSRLAIAITSLLLSPRHLI